MTDAARALEHLDLADREEVRLGLRTVFVSRVEEGPVFDRCFEAFWRRPAEDEPVMQGLINVPQGGEPPDAPPGTPKVASQKR